MNVFADKTSIVLLSGGDGNPFRLDESHIHDCRMGAYPLTNAVIGASIRQRIVMYNREPLMRAPYRQASILNNIVAY